MSDTHTPLKIAIDGPAASGKSTVAKHIAAKLGLVFVNSGAMYRAFTHHVLENGIDTADTDAVLKCLNETTFDCGKRDGASTIGVNGTELTEAQLSSTQVNDNVSAIAKIPEVRNRLVAEQRAYGEKPPGVVMEGRDIGTVVFADTPHKFYIDASPEVRAERRRAQGIDDEILERDKADSNRKTAPLTIADDAVVIDSSHLTADEVVAKVIAHLPDISNSSSADMIQRKLPSFPFNYGLAHAFFKFVGWYFGRYKVHHREKLRQDLDGVMIASNHVSFLDPSLVGVAYDEPIYYFARKTLFDHPVANWFLTRWWAIPVSQDKPELSALKRVINLLKDGQKVVIFPEGERSWDGKLKEKGQAGVGMMVAKAKVPVVPTRFFGAEKVLPRGVKKLTKHPIHLVVGDTLDFTDLIENGGLKGKVLYQEIADQIMAAIGALELPEDQQAD